ncbi:acyl-CoA/acyl-ACP dehydrogenase [Yinghuangia sp. ASG 101]|uniref:acyl-CoA dehydrogenase family protein n=1 Tax=Yinghuangia sp. ASG 101 TaxID=2896848 RepID=UPI001E3EEE56|nr:acyl-CoA dehydrogenase family protein [Yinghuangia sp. ASG 101]UGQ13305.1 acyl-CoA/acyl-ACP dehydrogenase [Yinghuangia sp. ASG 101]
MTEIPSLLYTDIEDDLRAALRGLLADRCAWSDVLARIDGDEPYDDALWKAVAVELGLAGLLVPESLGGAGATARESAVAMEELGRAVAPVPYLASAVLATAALLAAPEGTVRDDALRALASGARTATLAVPATTWPGSGFPDALGGTPHGDGRVRLRGTVTAVPAADRADVLVLPVVVDGAPCLAVADASAEGVSRSRTTTLDATRPVGTVVLDDVTATAIAAAGPAEEALRRALTVGAALLASEQLAVAERALEETVGYLKVRHQFGRPIGSYQALRHRAADLWADIAAARAAARYAAAAVAEESPDAAVAASLAQAFCGDVAVHAAEECVQMHGGIGFTWEHPAHLYLKRAMSTNLLLGTPDRHRGHLATLVGLPPTP